METVEQLNGQHALVFYNFQHDRERLLKALGKTGLHTRVYESAQDEADWNDGKIDILLAHPASCAYGLNLQRGGHHVIWFGLTWSLELYQQANKRLHRQGQEYPVIVHHLVVRGGIISIHAPHTGSDAYAACWMRARGTTGMHPRFCKDKGVKHADLSGF